MTPFKRAFYTRMSHGFKDICSESVARTVFAIWTVGPSPIGSVKGRPNSMRSGQLELV